MAKQQWDGRQWWQWDGAQWQPADPQPPAPPPDNHPDTATGPSPATTGHRSSRSGWIVGGIVVLLFAAGGLAYTGGVVFFALDSRLRYGHFVWHLFVVAGTICHYFAVLYYAG